MRVTGSTKQHILSTVVIAAVMFLFGTQAQAATNYTIYSAPTSLSFSVQAGGAASTKSVNVNDTTPAPLPFTISADQTWITLSAASSSTQRGGVVLQFGVNPAGLAAGSYTGHVLLTASGVTNSPLSIPVTLTITSATSVAPAITTQPSSKSITAGQTATFSVASTGTAPMTYQWKKNGTMVSGATSSSYTTPAETTADNSAQFSVVVSNGAGSATSGSATLTVTAATGTPYVIRTINPLTFSSAAGKNPAAQSVTSSDTSPIAPTYTVSSTATWLTATHVTTSGSGGYVIPVNVNASGLAAGTYSGNVIITIPDQSGYTWTNSPYSVPVTLTVTSSTAVAPTITTQPSSTTVTAGQTASFNVAATGTAPMTFQWKKNGTSVSGATSSSYTTAAETVSDNSAQITVMVSNSMGNATSNAAVMTVNAATVVAPSITMQPVSKAVTSGQTATFTVAATGTAPMTYQWMKGGTAVTGATSSSYTTPAETTSDNNAQISVTVTNSAGTATSNSATLTVNAGTLVLNSSSSALNFGNVNVSSSGNQTVTLTNAGTSSVTISNVSISGAGFNASGVSTGLILSPGQTATLTATFSPSAAGSASGSVAVASNASNSPDSITLSGTGVAVVNHSVALSWTASTSSVTGYNTYSGTKSGGPYTRLTSAPDAGTSYTDSTVQAGLTYYYVVTSVNSSNVESLYSPEISTTIP